MTTLTETGLTPLQFVCPFLAVRASIWIWKERTLYCCIVYHNGTSSWTICKVVGFFNCCRTTKNHACTAKALKRQLLKLNSKAHQTLLGGKEIFVRSETSWARLTYSYHGVKSSSWWTCFAFKIVWDHYGGVAMATVRAESGSGRVRSNMNKTFFFVTLALNKQPLNFRSWN